MSKSLNTPELQSHGLTLGPSSSQQSTMEETPLSIGSTSDDEMEPIYLVSGTGLEHPMGKCAECFTPMEAYGISAKLKFGIPHKETSRQSRQQAREYLGTKRENGKDRQGSSPLKNRLQPQEVYCVYSNESFISTVISI